MRPPLRIRSYIRPQALRLISQRLGNYQDSCQERHDYMALNFQAQRLYELVWVRLGIAWQPSNHLTADSQAFYEVLEYARAKYGRARIDAQAFFRGSIE